MARLARVILPGFPHHITQRGNRRQDVFFKEDDYLYYLELLKQWCEQQSVEVWSYCLMTNHVHLILVPRENANLSKAIAEVHRRYTRMINFREQWRGYLWQGRFASYPMQKKWLEKAMAYVELNPVKAGMVKQAWDYRWSSVHAHLSGYDENGLVEVKKSQKLVGNWKNYLLNAQGLPMKEIESHRKTGRPLGDKRFLDHAEAITGRDLTKKKPGPKSNK
ncbi:MAG: transposase [Enterobacterales bacterium]|nr:transposase [Enterobacterales bacterium]